MKTPILSLCAVLLLSQTHGWRHDTVHQRLILAAVVIVAIVLISAGARRLLGGAKPKQRGKRQGRYAIVRNGD